MEQPRSRVGAAQKPRWNSRIARSRVGAAGSPGAALEQEDHQEPRWSRPGTAGLPGTALEQPRSRVGAGTALEQESRRIRPSLGAGSSGALKHNQSRGSRNSLEEQPGPAKQLRETFQSRGTAQKSPKEPREAFQPRAARKNSLEDQPPRSQQTFQEPDRPGTRRPSRINRPTMNRPMQLPSWIVKPTSRLTNQNSHEPWGEQLSKAVLSVLFVPWDPRTRPTRQDFQGVSRPTRPPGSLSQRGD